MKNLVKPFAAVCLFSLAGVCAEGQFYKLHQADLGGSAIGQFTTPLTTTNPLVVQRTTDSFGGMLTLRDHPVTFAGVEANFGYTEFGESYNNPGYTARFQTDMYEATAAYLVHPHFRKLNPFIAIGGGAVDFVPHLGFNQWRGAGLLEAGLDIPTSNPHWGFRMQGRSLYYRDPNYGQPNLGSKTWVVTSEPSFGTWYRF